MNAAKHHSIFKVDTTLSRKDRIRKPSSKKVQLHVQNSKKLSLARVSKLTDKQLCDYLICDEVFKDYWAEANSDEEPTNLAHCF